MKAPKYVPAERCDLRWDEGPSVVLLAADGTWHSYTLTPSEACAMSRRLIGHIETLHRPTNDRTAETYEANPDLLSDD
jgi:hypothetical protein